MNQKVKCPYCGEETIAEIENPEDELLTQDECQHCGKVFNINVSISVDFTPSKCECQGVFHTWKLQKGFPECTTRWVCVHCGEGKPLTEEQRKRLKIQSTAEYFAELNKISIF